MDRPDGTPTTGDVRDVATWAAIEGRDKTFYAAGGVVTGGGLVLWNYVVPAGKRLYIVSTSFSMKYTVLADTVNIAHCTALINVAGAIVHEQSGDSGGYIPTAKPIVVEAGETIFAMLSNWSFKDAIGSITSIGYEVDV